MALTGIRRIGGATGGGTEAADATGVTEATKAAGITEATEATGVIKATDAVGVTDATCARGAGATDADALRWSNSMKCV